MHIGGEYDQKSARITLYKEQNQSNFQNKTKTLEQSRNKKMNTRITQLMACAIAATSTLALQLEGAIEQRGGNKNRGTRVPDPETQNEATETHYENVDVPGPANWLWLGTDEYQAHTAVEKLDMLWGLMVPNNVEDGPQ